MSTTVPSCEDVTAEDIAAIEKVLQHIDHQNAKSAILGPLANWLLALRIFKEVELKFTFMKERAHIQQAHRTMLSAIMALGDFMLMASEQIGDEDLKAIGITKASIEANVKYVRSKYAQWYGRRDPKHVAATIAAIEAA